MRRNPAACSNAFGSSGFPFTSKEYTCFYAKVLDQHVEEAVDLLADIVQRPLFDPEELEREPHALLRQWRYETSHPVERVTVEILACTCGQLMGFNLHFGAKAREEPVITTTTDLACTRRVEVGAELRRATA